MVGKGLTGFIDTCTADIDGGEYTCVSVRMSVCLCTPNMVVKSQAYKWRSWLYVSACKCAHVCSVVELIHAQL